MADTGKGSAVILAIDPGRKKTGVAIGNKITDTARPLQTVTGNFATQVSAVVTICGKWFPGTLVVGLPDPTIAKAAHSYCTRFALALASKTDAEVTFFDEAYTTQAARAKRGNHPCGLDAQAASILANDWLQGERKTNP